VKKQLQRKVGSFFVCWAASTSEQSSFASSYIAASRYSKLNASKSAVMLWQCVSSQDKEDYTTVRHGVLQWSRRYQHSAVEMWRSWAGRRTWQEEKKEAAVYLPCRDALATWQTQAWRLNQRGVAMQWVVRWHRSQRLSSSWHSWRLHWMGKVNRKQRRKAPPPSLRETQLSQHSAAQQQLEFRDSHSGQAMSFDSIDNNNDGVISRAEWEQNRSYFQDRQVSSTASPSKGLLTNYGVALRNHFPGHYSM